MTAPSESVVHAVGIKTILKIKDGVELWAESVQGVVVYHVDAQGVRFATKNVTEAKKRFEKLTGEKLK